MLLNTGISVYQFDEILVNTLREDRGAVVTVTAAPRTKPGAAVKVKEEDDSYCLDVPTDAVAKMLKQKYACTNDITASESQQLYNHKVAVRYGIEPEVADVEFVIACCGNAANRVVKDRMFALYKRYNDFFCITLDGGAGALVSVNARNLQFGRDEPKDGSRMMQHAVSRDNVHMIRAFEGGSLLMALVPDDVLAGLFEAPHEIALKVDDVYPKFDHYIAGLGDARYKTVVKAFDFEMKRYTLSPTAKQRQPFIKKVMAGSFNLGFSRKNFFPVKVPMNALLA